MHSFQPTLISLDFCTHYCLLIEKTLQLVVLSLEAISSYNFVLLVDFDLTYPVFVGQKLHHILLLTWNIHTAVIALVESERAGS